MAEIFIRLRLVIYYHRITRVNSVIHLSLELSADRSKPGNVIAFITRTFGRKVLEELRRYYGGMPEYTSTDRDMTSWGLMSRHEMSHHSSCCRISFCEAW